MRRHDDWPKRLSKALEAAEKRRFRYGLHDCFGFAARCEKAMCGNTVFADILTAYSSQQGAMRIMVEHGWKTVEDGAADRLEEINPMLAQRGDWVSVMSDDGPALAVCFGTLVYAPAKKGLETRPITMARRAWKI